MARKTREEIDYEKLVGQRFGRWVLIKYLNRNKQSAPVYECQCDCGTVKKVNVYSLKSGQSKSCGCLRKEKKPSRRKLNRYSVLGEYGVGYASNNNKEFYFDLEDYDKIKKYTWYMTKDEYIHSRINNKIVCLHRLILNITDTYILVDHIGHTPYDNRKINLRRVTVSQNQMNKKLLSNNTSGVTGVSFHKQANKWRAAIDCRGKQMHLGLFNTIEEATEARLEAEEKYHKEYSYNKSMETYEDIAMSKEGERE